MQISSGYAPTPVLSRSNYTVVGNYIKNLKLSVVSAVDNVQYQLQARGTVYNPASWVSLGSLGGGLYGPVPNFEKGQQTLYAKSAKAGDTDSPVVSWNL